MKYNPDIHHRRSIRLKGYDYSQNGLYFITICTHNRDCLFGDITDGLMILNPMGEIAHKEWQKTAQMRPNIRLHEFIIMPNHIHVIIEITPQNATPVGARCTRPTMPAPHRSINPAPHRSINPTHQRSIDPINQRSIDPINQRSIDPTHQRSIDPANQRSIGWCVNLGRVQRAPTVGDIVRGYKSSVTKHINQLRNMPGAPIWQRNYHEHIIRNEIAYRRIAQYVQSNPQKWQADIFHS